MTIFDFEKWSAISEMIKDPFISEHISFIIQVCGFLFGTFFIGYLFGQIFPVFDFVLDKYFEYKLRKGD